MMRNVMLLLAYDGTLFHGWQFQPGMRTVQECLEQALRRTLRHRVAVIGCSRTDSGVHAAGYVANLYTTNVAPLVGLARSIGSRLPKDVTLVDLREVPLTFHATQSAVSKLYRYRIFAWPGRPCEQHLQNQTYHMWESLDVAPMREAVRHWVGEHDFTSFASAGNDRQSNVRRIHLIEVTRAGREIRVDIEGDGFLYKQVRNMVGTLCEIGRGHWGPERAKKILAARTRDAAGPTAPARGLCLQWVKYDIPGLPEPSPAMLEAAAQARAPSRAELARVDERPMSSAPTVPGVSLEEESCG
jgi:tRNA pseudouridine38-40 synthase